MDCPEADALKSARQDCKLKKVGRKVVCIEKAKVYYERSRLRFIAEHSADAAVLQKSGGRIDVQHATPLLEGCLYCLIDDIGQQLCPVLTRRTSGLVHIEEVAAGAIPSRL